MELTTQAHHISRHAAEATQDGSTCGGITHYVYVYVYCWEHSSTCDFRGWLDDGMVRRLDGGWNSVPWAWLELEII